MASLINNAPEILKETFYVQNSFSVIFPRQLDIRRKLVDFENILSDEYGQPQSISLPDELDADIPRAIFPSKGGHSQITVTQINIVLTVNYSPDWQVDDDLRKKYLLSRANTVFDLVERIQPKSKPVKPLFCGLVTVARIPFAEQSNIISYLCQLLKVDNPTNIHDLNRRVARIEKKKYFNNIVIENYRTWDIVGVPQGPLNLKPKDAKEHGIQISGDYNDRYAYQERSSYFTKKNEMFKVIEQGLEAVTQAVNEVRGAS